MCKAIDEYCERTGQIAPRTPAEYIRCIYRSLAHRYTTIIDILQGLSPTPIKCLHVIGGGSKNPHLMQFTADALQMPVICGPTEGTALGNVLMQIKSQGLVKNLVDMRKIVAESVELKQYNPSV